MRLFLMFGCLGAHAGLIAPSFAEISPELRSSAAASQAAAGGADLEAAKALAADAFGSGLGSPGSEAPAVEASAPDARAGAPAPSLTSPTSRGAFPGSVPEPASEKEWNPKRKGWGGFNNGFSKGFAWTETPALNVYEAGFAKGSSFWIPTPFYFFTTVAAIVTGIALAPIALVAGAARGVCGAIAGEKEF